jgi:hypothetical protein
MCCTTKGCVQVAVDALLAPLWNAGAASAGQVIGVSTPVIARCRTCVSCPVLFQPALGIDHCIECPCKGCAVQVTCMRAFFNSASLRQLQMRPDIRQTAISRSSAATRPSTGPKQKHGQNESVSALGRSWAPAEGGLVRVGLSGPDRGAMKRNSFFFEALPALEAIGFFVRCCKTPNQSFP